MFEMVQGPWSLVGRLVTGVENALGAGSLQNAREAAKDSATRRIAWTHVIENRSEEPPAA